jgi:colanic acid/amylovoran biosynthesis glycosyltransferase
VKVAFFVGLFPCISQTFVLNQITGLIDRGHDVDIFAFHGDDPSQVHPDVSKYRLLEKTCYLDSPITGNFLSRLLKGLTLFGANIQNAPLVLLRSLNVVKYGRQAVSLRLLYATIPLIEKRQTQGKLVYDIIHAQFGTQGLEALRFRELGAIHGKLITNFRGYDISQYLQVMGEHVYRPLFKSGDFFLTNCEFFAHRALKIGCAKNKLRVLGSGIDCDRFTFAPRYPPDDGAIRIVTTGRLVEKKGIEYGIRAIAQLAKTHSQIQYLIIGDGPLKATLQALVDELHIN